MGTDAENQEVGYMYFNLPPTWFLWIWFGVTIAALILEMVLYTKSY
jgi:hypothetical protein